MRSSDRTNRRFGLEELRIAAVIRSVAERHEDNSGNREPLSKMERSDILDNVCDLPKLDALEKISPVKQGWKFFQSWRTILTEKPARFRSR